MTFENAMEIVVVSFELVGIAILAGGSVRALAEASLAFRRGQTEGLYAKARLQVGQAILLGLEVLIIADIVKTVTIDPSVESALFLGVIVLVRTFLSFSIEIELDGVVPWRRRQVMGERSRQGDPVPPA